jgi:hypothetical protein
VILNPTDALNLRLIVGVQNLRAYLATFGIEELLVSPAQTAGTALFLVRGGIGYILFEKALDTEYPRGQAVHGRLRRPRRRRCSSRRTRRRCSRDGDRCVMAEPLKVKALRPPSTSRPRRVREALMQHVGFDTAGKPVVQPATRIVFLDRGEALPDGLSDDEVERLKAIDAVGPADEVDALIARLADPAGAEAADREAAEARLALQLSPDVSGPVAGRTDDELAAWLENDKPNADETVAAAGDDPALARRLLDAENAREKPRVGVVEGLQKVVDAASASVAA